MKKYIISALTFKTKKEAEEQIREWMDNNTFNQKSVIYEIDDKIKQYEAEVKLVKKKERKPVKFESMLEALGNNPF